MVAELESDGRFELLELPGSEFDEESVSFVRNLDNLGPRESVDSKSVAVDENSWKNTWLFFCHVSIS